MHRVLCAFLLSVSLALGLAVGSAAATHDRGTGSYAPFVGSWGHHGFSLEVTTAGTAYAVYRTYTWCGAQQHAGCDRIVGNQIYAGACGLRTCNGPRDQASVGSLAPAPTPPWPGRRSVWCARRTICCC